jgi:pyruvate,water dikinase
MNKAIEGLAQIVNSDINLKNAILCLKDIDKKILDNKLEKLAISYKEFGEHYHQLLKEFGWKSANSYQAFNTVSWNENKQNFITLLHISMESEASKEEKNKYSSICKKIVNTFSKRKARNMFKRIEQIRTYHVNREESLYMLERCYGLSRKIINEIANKLDTESSQDFFIKQINIRKKSRRKNEMLWENCELSDINDKDDVLKGVSGNRGKVTGKVCIIENITEFSKLKKGEILVCKYTDPSWTPLFSLAKAVVSNTGGPLSHSAIVAREYNIPAVLGCGNVTKILKDGQNIIVDGDRGIVQVLGLE